MDSLIGLFKDLVLFFMFPFAKQLIEKLKAFFVMRPYSSLFQQK